MIVRRAVEADIDRLAPCAAVGAESEMDALCRQTLAFGLYNSLWASGRWVWYAEEAGQPLLLFGLSLSDQPQLWLMPSRYFLEDRSRFWALSQALVALCLAKVECFDSWVADGDDKAIRWAQHLGATAVPRGDGLTRIRVTR